MWDITTPAGNEKLVRGDDRIREWKQDLEFALQEEHNFPINNNSPSLTHKFLHGDEATKPLPSSTSNRFFIHTAKNTIQFEKNGIWEDIASCLPSGTRMIFANLSAITGWTRVAIDEKLLKVLGGDTNEGGSWQISGYNCDSKDMPHVHYSIYLYCSNEIYVSAWNNVDQGDQSSLDYMGTKADGDSYFHHTHPFSTAGYSGEGGASSNCDQISTSPLWHTHEITYSDWKLKYFVCTVCEKD